MRRPRLKSIRFVGAVVSVAYLWAVAPAKGAEDGTEVGGENTTAAIEHLLSFVAHSDATFIRNRKDHTGEEAEDHMRKKYEHFRKKIRTPEDFIRLAATKSLLSKKPYTVRIAEGNVIASSEWLQAELKRYREEQNSSSP